MGKEKLPQAFVLWKAKNKDPESFAMVYDMYMDRIFRFIFFKVRDKELAQDFAAETFLKTWEYINSDKKVDNINALLYRIARNLVIDHFRKKASTEVSLDQTMIEIYENDNTFAHAYDLTAQLDNKLEIERILDKIQELKDEYREILILRYVEGFNIKEIAQISEKKSGAVRVMLHRAQKALEGLLLEE